MSPTMRWLVAALLVVPGRLVAQISADTAALIDQVFTAFNQSDAPGCSIGIDRNGAPLFRRGYGMASLESGVPMTEFSVVESGSVAKQFTAGAINYLRSKANSASMTRSKNTFRNSPTTASRSLFGWR